MLLEAAFVHRRVAGGRALRAGTGARPGDGGGAEEEEARVADVERAQPRVVQQAHARGRAALDLPPQPPWRTGYCHGPKLLGSEEIIRIVSLPHAQNKRKQEAKA